MALMDGGILSLMPRRLAYLGQKQAVLAQNVANANTPGYKAKELASFETFSDVMKSASSGMSVTNARHIVPPSMAGANAATKPMKSYEVVMTGNTVDLEQQMMEVSKTAVEYQADTSIYQKFIGLLKLAITSR